MNWLILALPVFALVSSVPVGGACKVVSAIAEASASERLQHIQALHSAGKAAIPRLLNELGDSTRVYLNLSNPASSHAELPLWRHCGVVAAYLIEVLLAKSALRIEGADDTSSFFLGVDPSNYPFHAGVVEHADGRRFADSDARKLSNAYHTWWSASQNRNLDQLRTDWQHGRRPLQHSGLRWR